MAVRTGAVVVKELPERLTDKHGRSFFYELECDLMRDNSRIVLDCSKVRRMDRPSIYVLLCCLEAAMKHNGDVKLASLPPEIKAIFELTGVARLFESFDSKTEAIASFCRISVEATSNSSMSGSTTRASETVA